MSQNLFSLGDEVISKCGTVFVITGIEADKGKLYYFGKSKKKLVRFAESSLNTYFPGDAVAKVKVAYAYENIRTGKIEKYTKQRNINQHSRRAPAFDERYVG